MFHRLQMHATAQWTIKAIAIWRRALFFIEGALIYQCDRNEKVLISIFLSVAMNKGHRKLVDGVQGS